MEPFEDSIAIPFRIPGAYQGLAEVAGLLHVREGSLFLEFRISDAIIGLLRTRVRDVQLSLFDLDSVTFHNGWFRKRLYIHVRRLSVLADLPGAADGTIEMRIKRRHCARMKEAVSRITLAISEARLRAIERQAERDVDRLVE